MPLAIIPTPIGNLEDVTLRALRYLREADLVACEDTRRTGRLLAHYEIEKDLVAYHEHNEERLAPDLAERAKTQRVALLTDAGTPLVSDPGYRLVRACIEAGVEIEVLPGPSALTTALVASGLPADTVVFAGFPPRKGRGRTELLERIATEPSTFVLFESPHRLAKTLENLPAEAPVAICRELTKLHEEVFRGRSPKPPNATRGGLGARSCYSSGAVRRGRLRISRRSSRRRGGTSRKERARRGRRRGRLENLVEGVVRSTTV